MAYRLATDDGRLPTGTGDRKGSLLVGASMQWLNPKAWLAAVAGVGAFASGGDAAGLWTFAAIYFVVCFASMASWAAAGALMRQALQTPARMRALNTALALFLVVSALYMLAAS